MKVLVTGGAGFIGSHLVDALLANGDSVRVLDNLTTGRTENLADKKVDLIVGDVCHFADVQGAMEGCDLVFHQAALVSVPFSIEQPLQNYAINLNGTLHMFEAARQAGIKRVVYASSSAVYGEQATMPIAESADLAPQSPYALSKHLNEQLAHSYNTTYGMEIVGLRYMNVFGPRQRADSPYSGVISIFLNRLLQRQPLTIYGDGEQTRDFIFVSDVVRANLHAAAAPFQVAQSVFNIGRGEAITLNQLVAAMQQVVGDTTNVDYAKVRAGDIRHSCADTRRAQGWGFSAEKSLTDGLAATTQWLST